MLPPLSDESTSPLSGSSLVVSARLVPACSSAESPPNSCLRSDSPCLERTCVFSRAFTVSGVSKRFLPWENALEEMKAWDFQRMLHDFDSYNNKINTWQSLLPPPGSSSFWWFRSKIHRLDQLAQSRHWDLPHSGSETTDWTPDEPTDIGCGHCKLVWKIMLISSVPMIQVFFSSVIGPTKSTVSVSLNLFEKR